MPENKEDGYGIRRKEWKRTRSGIVLFYKSEKNPPWTIGLPDDTREFGIPFARVVSYLAYINEGDSLKETKRKLRWKVTV